MTKQHIFQYYQPQGDFHEILNATTQKNAATHQPPSTQDLVPVALSLPPNFDESTPPLTAFDAAISHTFDSRRDERSSLSASRVDRVLALPESSKIPVCNLIVSAVRSARPERTVRIVEDDAEAIFDDDLLDLLAKAEVSRWQA